MEEMINASTRSPVNSQIMRISHATCSKWIADGKRKVKDERGTAAAYCASWVWKRLPASYVAVE
jgi:hypothetical protein